MTPCNINFLLTLNIVFMNVLITLLLRIHFYVYADLNYKLICVCELMYANLIFFIGDKKSVTIVESNESIASFR